MKKKDWKDKIMWELNPYGEDILAEQAEKVIEIVEVELDKAREEGYKKGYIDGQTEKTNKPKPVMSEFDKTSYLN